MRFGCILWILCIGCSSFASDWQPKWSKGAINATFEGRTKLLERGRLVAQNSFYSHLTGLIRKEQWGLYGDCETILPLQNRSLFSNRWKFAGGFLKKATEHFTLDVGLSYTRLSRQTFELLPHWTENYCGVRSDLLMQPSCYFFWDYDRHQWGIENQFHYDFDLSIFDLDRLSIVWENKLGFWKGRRPYGPHAGKRNRKYRYINLETGIFLTYKIKSCWFYAGPTFAYNSGGTKPDTLINTATHRSHFSTWRFGCKMIL